MARLETTGVSRFVRFTGHCYARAKTTALAGDFGGQW